MIHYQQYTNYQQFLYHKFYIALTFCYAQIMQQWET